MRTLNKCARTGERRRQAELSKLPVLDTELVTHHRRSDLHTLVSDIGRYPEFIRWIKALRVSNSREEAGVTYQLGEVVVGFKGFSERFATNVVSNPLECTVTADLVRGPFRRLRNAWKFTDQENGQTRVNFHLDYEFSNPVLAMLARSNTEKAVGKIMEAFITEADRRFGASEPSSHI